MKYAEDRLSIAGPVFFGKIGNVPRAGVENGAVLSVLETKCIKFIFFNFLILFCPLGQIYQIYFFPVWCCHIFNI